MSELVVSEIQIIPVLPKNGLIAFVSCVINNQLSLNNIALYTRPDGNGYRLVYPSKILPNGKQINSVYPINKEAGETIKTMIVNKFEELLLKPVKNRRSF